jgi:hypothetical protein
VRRWTALAAVLTAGALVVGATTPALAAELPELTCKKWDESRVYDLSAIAVYEDSTNYRTFTAFRFMVHGGRLDADHNNVNIKVSEYGQVIYSYKSPDNLEYNRWYSHRPSTTVRTNLRGPNGERDHRTNGQIWVEAIFDRPGIYDLKCTDTQGTP